MAAILEIDESNGLVETITHGISSALYGSIDAPNLSPAVMANAVAASTNSYEKWWRWHLTDLGGASAVGNFRIWASGSPATGGTHYYCGSTDPATYATTKQTAYSAPAQTTTRATVAFPTSDPEAAAIGVGGSLTTTLTAAGYTDYLVSQIRLSTGATAGATFSLTYGYDELA